MKIDYDRGVTIRIDPKTGTKIYMYKDEPGVFLNGHGHEVEDSLAARCGFDTKSLKRLKAKRDAIKQAHDEIEAQFEGDDATGPTDKVVEENAEGYRIVQKLFGRHAVYSPEPEGEKLHDGWLTKEEAHHLFNTIVKSTEPEAVEEKEDGSPT